MAGTKRFKSLALCKRWFELLKGRNGNRHCARRVYQWNQHWMQHFLAESVVVFHVFKTNTRRQQWLHRQSRILPLDMPRPRRTLSSLSRSECRFIEPRKKCLQHPSRRMPFGAPHPRTSLLQSEHRPAKSPSEHHLPHVQSERLLGKPQRKWHLPL